MSRKSKGRLYLRGKTYWLEYYVKGKRFQQSLKTSNPKDAEQQRKDILLPLQTAGEASQLKSFIHRLRDTEEEVQKLKESRTKKLLMLDTWSVYLRSPERPDTGEATLKQYKGQWSNFAKWCNQRNHIKQLDDVTKEDASDYFHALKESGRASGTINKHLGLLKLVYRVIGKDHGVMDNPFENIRKLKETQEHRKEIPENVLGELIEKADVDLKYLLTLGAETGLRLKDCCLLEKSSVDLGSGWITVEPHKTQYHNSEPIHLKITDELRPLLEMSFSKSTSEYVHTKLATDYSTNETRVTNRIQAHFKKCGLRIYKPGTGPGTKKRAVLHYGFHSLRHSFVTKHQANGTPQAVVMHMVGHKSRSINQKYTHISRNMIEQAMDNVSHNLKINTNLETPATTSVIALLQMANEENWAQLIEASLILLKSS